MITISQMLIMAEEIVGMLSKDTEHIKLKTQTEPLEMENTMSEMKDTQDGTDSRFKIAKRNISETANMIMETI